MWVFGYGSLMWDEWEKEFDGRKHENSKILDYHREFNKKSLCNWGSPQIPGLTLGLEEEIGSECFGIAFEFSDEKKEQVLQYLRRREGMSFSIPEIEVILNNGTSVKAFTAINSRTSQTYFDAKNISEKIRMVIYAKGSSGKCIDYVCNLRNNLIESGIKDEHVERFWEELTNFAGEDEK